MKCVGRPAKSDCRVSARTENTNDDEDDIYSGFNDDNDPDYAHGDGPRLLTDVSRDSGFPSNDSLLRRSASHGISRLNTAVTCPPLSRDRRLGTPKSYSPLRRLTPIHGAGFTSRSSVDGALFLSGKTPNRCIATGNGFSSSQVFASSSNQTCRISATVPIAGTKSKTGLLVMPEDKVRCIEKIVNQLLNESYSANESGNFMIALDKAKV